VLEMVAVFHPNVLPPSAPMTGLGISPDRLLKNRIVQSQIRHKPLEPPVLLLQFL
jgi:hypothetical protein